MFSFQRSILMLPSKHLLYYIKFFFFCQVFDITFFRLLFLLKALDIIPNYYFAVYLFAFLFSKKFVGSIKPYKLLN